MGNAAPSTKLTTSGSGMTMDAGAWQYSAYDLTVKAATRAIADGLDDPRRLHARRVGKLRLDDVNLDERHPGSYVGLRHLGERQHLGTAGIAEHDRFYPRHPRRRH